MGSGKNLAIKIIAGIQRRELSYQMLPSLGPLKYDQNSKTGQAISYFRLIIDEFIIALISLVETDSYIID